MARALPATVIAALGGEGDDIHHRVVLPSGEVRVVRELATVDFTVVRRTEPKS